MHTSHGRSLGILSITWGLGMAMGILCAATTSAQTLTTPTPHISDVRVGFDGLYKAGYWTPLWIDVVAGAEPFHGSIEAAVVDSDGVPVRFTGPALQPLELEAGESASVLQYVLFGRVSSPLTVALVDQTGNIVAEKQLVSPASALPAVGQLLLELGPAPVGLADANPQRTAPGGRSDRRVVHVSDPGTLPTSWQGFAGVDAVLLSASDVQWVERFADDPARPAALQRWVEMGGSLVLACGAQAPRLLSESGVLANFVPGKFVDMVALPRSIAIEEYSQADRSIPAPDAGGAWNVPRLAEVVGHIEAHAGRRPTDLPIVIRSPRGFGQLTFAGVDLDRPPLADWPGRILLMRALLGYSPESPDEQAASAAIVTEEYSDVAGAVRQRLGRSFPGMTPIPFSWVAMLCIVYIVLIGPVDYWLNKRAFRRAAWAWITFPVLVVAACLAAYWLAGATKGNRLAVNQAEVIDFDLASELARGTFWATVYSPRHQRYTLVVKPPPWTTSSSDAPQVLLASLGLAGRGLGGMQSAITQDEATTAGYHVDAQLNQLDDVPIAIWSTKSVTATWSVPVQPPIDADLVQTIDGLLDGRLANRSGIDLSDALLLYGGWAYRLGELPDDATVDLSSHRDPARATMALTRDLRTSLPGREPGETRDVFLANRASLENLVDVLMFYEAMGGYAFVRLPNHYQSRCDLSRLLALGRAILMARGPATASSRLLVDGRPDQIGDGTRSVTYRFVIPVEPVETTDQP